VIRERTTRLENTLIRLQGESLLKARQKTEPRQHLKTMAWHLLCCKQRQITWFVDVQGDTWETADCDRQVTLSRQAQMPLKAIVAKGQGETVWGRQDNRVRSQIVPVGH
jgi:hypothetical protein